MTWNETLKLLKTFLYFFFLVLLFSFYCPQCLDVLYSPRSSYVVVVAIDFGTTYSGFAFSVIKDEGKDSVFMNREWLNEQGTRTSKTPTCLLLKPDLSFDCFGYGAVEKYANLQDENSEQKYYFSSILKWIFTTTR